MKRIRQAAQRLRSAAVTPHHADLEVLNKATGGVTVGCISWLGDIAEYWRRKLSFL